MAFLDEEYSVDTLPQSTSNFEPLPEGWYNAAITGAEIKATKAGDGKYIACKYTITGPSHQGRVIFGNLNIKNASTKAEEIGRQQRYESVGFKPSVLQKMAKTVKDATRSLDKWM
jgi:hypothetical protein